MTHLNLSFSDEPLEDLVSGFITDDIEFMNSSEFDLDLSDSSLDKVLWEDDEFMFVAED